MTTTTTTPSIKCGNCKATHGSVADVKACYAGTPVAHVAATTPAKATPGARAQAIREGHKGGACNCPTAYSRCHYAVQADFAAGDLSLGHGGWGWPSTPAPVAQAPAKAEKPASEKQVAFALRLEAERDVPVAGATVEEATHIARLEDMMGGGKFVSSREASAVIEWLLTIPKAAPAQHPEAQAAAQAEPLTHGMYRQGETIFKIQKAVHGSGHLYAKRLVPGDGYGAKATFVYAPGAMKALTLADKMTLEEAKEWGALYGTCCVCGRTLTNEGSIEAGIGPVCAGKF